ncbi:hypothetical protein FANTH_4415 [Fusarium anthophilum]|uniref:Transcription factor domain-containing protein n=1 Tax=Fusarium anthophilum TaxID=48485 RepID=A0A8H4ZQ59_9HYPO|nr:hypothetical protein FANTH_4415 [Fusarium anthophilum]
MALRAPMFGRSVALTVASHSLAVVPEVLLRSITETTSPCGRCHSDGIPCVPCLPRGLTPSLWSTFNPDAFLSLDSGSGEQDENTEMLMEADSQSSSDFGQILSARLDSENQLGRPAPSPSEPLHSRSIGGQTGCENSGLKARQTERSGSGISIEGPNSSLRPSQYIAPEGNPPLAPTLSYNNQTTTENLLQSSGEPSHVLSPLQWDWGQLFGSQAVGPDFQAMLALDSTSQTSPGAPTLRANTASSQSVDCVARLGDNFADKTAPWTQVLSKYREQHFHEDERFTNVAINEKTREQILVVAQAFFRQALAKLNINSNPGCQSLLMDLEKHSTSQVLLLPSTDILSIFLETFLTSFEPFYPMIPQRSLNPNIVNPDGHQGLSVLWLLLILSYGAMRDPAIRARRLSIGLLEISRLALLEIMDRDNSTPRIAMASHCALICCYQSAFSGYKWLANSGLGQIKMYLTTANQSGFFKSWVRNSWVNMAEKDVEGTWQEWLKVESYSRLACCWAIVDQEISLMYDSAPALTMRDLESCLPEGDNLWLASDASSWRRAYEEINGPTSDSPRSLNISQMSLPQLFGLLLEDRISSSELRLSILHMRLLLCPLHIIISQLSGSLKFSYDTIPRRISMPMGHIFTSLRLDEVQSLLRAWYRIFKDMQPTSTRQRALKQSTIVLYYLLNLNVAASFPPLEQYFQDVSPKPDAGHDLLKTSIRMPEQSILYCGQVVRLVREMDLELRPLWWPTAVYRVAVILWALSNSTPATNISATAGDTLNVMVDASSPDDHACQNLLKHGKGKPCLTSEDGTFVPLEDGIRVLHVCIDVLKQHRGTSMLAEELIGKLQRDASLEVGIEFDKCGSL